MRIDVTAEDIAKGKRRDSCLCPIARAVSRAFDQDITNLWCSIGPDAGTTGDLRSRPWNLHAQGEEVRLPDEAGLFAASFDDGEPVAPFSFELNLPNK